MTLKEALKAYQAGWDEVEAFIKEERRMASLELRWRQLKQRVFDGERIGITARGSQRSRGN